jgi:Putative adhesin
MGKRELLLVVAFIFVGAVVYQVAAPAGPAREGGFSFSRMLDNLRREVRENSAEAEETVQRTIPLDRTVTELRVSGGGGGHLAALKIVGEARTDIAADLRVHSTGVDEAEARTLIKRTLLKSEQTGEVIALSVSYPPEGRQRGSLTLRVPKQITIRLRETRGATELDDIGDLFLDDARGEIIIGQLAGELRGTFQGGRLRADTVRVIKLTSRRGEVEIDQVAADATLDISGGSLRVSRIGGALELTANRAEVEIDEIGGAVRANTSDGSLDLSGLKRETRIDARSTEVMIELAAAVPLTAITNEESLVVRLPEQAGVTIDATAASGEIRLPDSVVGSVHLVKTPDEQRARGAIRGGGPTLSLHVTRGDIVIR